MQMVKHPGIQIFQHSDVYGLGSELVVSMGKRDKEEEHREEHKIP